MYDAVVAEPLLSVEFDLKPFDSEVDQRIRATLLPIQVLYDAVSAVCCTGSVLVECCVLHW